MWENAAKHTGTPPAPPAAAEPGEYDTLLWAQIILCVLIAAGVFAARALELPLYSTLRTDYRYALAQPGPDFWNTDGSRNVVRFTQETFAELRGVLRQVAAQTPETAARTGTAHGQPLASAEAYLPGVMLQYPLPGKPAVETSAYGTRIDPVQGKTQEFHTGADLSAVQGTPVYAAASGVVRIARNHASYGNYVRLLHPGGDETIYAHLQYLFVRQGQQIQAGQCLGTVGQTGNATGPHLHFELLHAGVRYDPTRALAKAGLQAEP